MRGSRREGKLSRFVMCAAVVVSAIGLLAVGCGSSSSSKAVEKKASQVRIRQRTPTLPVLIAQVRSGVVRIEATTCDGGVEGTGFLLDSRHVATVEHVIDRATTITLKQNGKVVGTGTVIGADATRDLALLQTSSPIGGYHFTISPRAPGLAEEVAALGFPLGLPLSVTRGVVSGSDRTIPIDGINRRKLVQTDAAVNPGNSGGPLIATSTGEVVGLVDLGTDQANGLAFAVSGLVANPLLEAWRVGPQPIAASSCESTVSPPPVAAPAPPPPPSSAPNLTSFTGNDFSVAYPTDWTVRTAEAQKPGYLDTTIDGPAGSGLLLRVDLDLDAGTTDPVAAAAPVVRGLRAQSGYRELGYRRTTFFGFNALYWEFLVRENGVVLHKVDIFFIDDLGQGWAALVEAPTGDWGVWQTTFTDMLNSLTLSGSTPAQLPGPSGRLYAVTRDVSIYSGPTTTASPVGAIPAGTMIGVQCKASGETINGIYGPDHYWDQVTFSGVTGFVTDEWVDTRQDEHDPTKIPLC